MYCSALGRTFAVLLGVSICLAAFTAPRCFAQEESPDSTAKRATQAEPRRWGVGVQVTPLFGLSVRYAFSERFAVQVAGLPVPVGDNRAAGARGLLKLYVQPSYNFFVSSGASALWSTEEFSSPFLEESGRDQEYFFFSTLGGEYRFANRLGLGVGIGLAYFVQRSPIFDRDEVVPVLELGLHYYF